MNQSSDTKYKIDILKSDLGIINCRLCTQEENIKFAEMIRNNEPIPDNVFMKKAFSTDNVSFYYILDEDISIDDEEELLNLQKTKDIKAIKQYMSTIKKCVMFFTTVSIISMIIWLLSELKIL